MVCKRSIKKGEGEVKKKTGYRNRKCTNTFVKNKTKTHTNMKAKWKTPSCCRRCFSNAVPRVASGQNQTGVVWMPFSSSSMSAQCLGVKQRPKPTTRTIAAAVGVSSTNTPREAWKSAEMTKYDKAQHQKNGSTFMWTYQCAFTVWRV